MANLAKLNVMITVTNIKNPAIITSANIMVPLEEQLTAADIKEFTEKVLTDSLAYHNDNDEWPEIDILDPNGPDDQIPGDEEESKS